MVPGVRGAPASRSAETTAELETRRPTGYRALLRVPGFGYLLASMLFGRVSGQMVAITLVLFVLARYHSPQLAGLTVLLTLSYVRLSDRGRRSRPPG